MWKNYLKIAWRNIRKDKLYSIINVLGLSTGILACLLVGLFVWNESTYDNFHTNGDRIVKAYTDYQVAGTRSQFDLTGTKVGPQLKRTFPQVQEFVRTMRFTRAVSNNTESFEEDRILYADSSFLDVFSFHLLTGNPKTVLDAPGKILLTPAMARKYFGEGEALGKTLKFDGGDVDYEVTGIIEPAPQNSQIQYDFVVSFSSLSASKTEMWSTANYQTYLLLQDGNQLQGLEKELQSYMKHMAQEEGEALNGTDYFTIHLEALGDIHLHSAVSNSFEANGNMRYIYVLSMIAVLILLIACVNYINMATAQSVRRSTEIGIRKVMGAEQQQLWKQFLGESFLCTCMATVIALLAAILLLPLFNTLTEKAFSMGVFLQLPVLIFLGGLCLLITLLSGMYPAFILTRTKLVHILKSGIRLSRSGGAMRKGLIVFQFIIAVFLIAFTFIISKQLHYIQNTKLGYERDQVIVLPVDERTRPHYPLLHQAISDLPQVISASGAYEDPTDIGWGDGIYYDKGDGRQNLVVNAGPVGLDYLKTMGMQLIAGRDFNQSDLALRDTTDQYAHYQYSFILNEEAVRKIGWTPEEAIGKTIYKNLPGTIVGVVKDFHFESLHQPIGPLVLFLDPDMIRQLFVKVQAGNVQQTLGALESLWKSRISHRPFSYHFMDEYFNRLYTAEQRTGTLFSLFSGVAILLACLGLFALTAFTTTQRTKEIGIRKVLGAGVSNITVMLSRQFLILVLIAIVIASALAWWAGIKWLQDYAYSIQMSGWIFVLAGVFALLIALLAVTYHAIKAAIANPVHSLKEE